MTRWWGPRFVVVGTAVVVGLLGPAATASAHHREFTLFPVTYALGHDNSIPCSGQLTGSVSTPHERPGTAIVSLAWSTFFTNPCTITAFVNYANTDHQTGGTRALELTSSSGRSDPRSTWTGQVAIDIGSGNASLTVTADSLSSTLLDPAAATVRFVVA